MIQLFMFEREGHRIEEVVANVVAFRPQLGIFLVIPCLMLFVIHI